MRRLTQKGFTLIELLAVIVILAIILIIAVPSVTGLIDDAKKDSYVSSAKMMVSAARLAVATDTGVTVAASGTDDAILIIASSLDMDLSKLPDGDAVDLTNSYVAVVENGTGYDYYVQLISSTDAKRGILATATAAESLAKTDVQASITIADYDIVAAETGVVISTGTAYTISAATTTTTAGTVYWDAVLVP